MFMLICLISCKSCSPNKTIITDNSEKALKANVTFSGEINNGIYILQSIN